MTNEAELLENMKALVRATNGWLTDSSGSDSEYVMAMQEGVSCVMETAQKIPALRDWAARERDYVEKRHQAVAAA